MKRFLSISITVLLTAVMPAQAFWGLLGKAASTTAKGAGTTAGAAAKVAGAGKVGGAALVGSEAVEAMTMLKMAGGKAAPLADEAMSLGTRAGLTVEEISKASGLKLGVPDEVAFYLRQSPTTLNEVQTSRIFDLYVESKSKALSVSSTVADATSKIHVHDAFRLLHLASQAGNRQAHSHYAEACKLQRLNWGFEAMKQNKAPRDRLHELEKIDAQCSV